MTKPARKRTKTLEVHVMFEPNRLADQLLHKAYTSLVPIPRRWMSMPESTSDVAAQRPGQSAERKIP